MDYILDDLQWKCPDCGVTAAPTSYDYMKLLKHQKARHIHLANEIRAEITAGNPKGARAKGIELSGNKHGLELTEDDITLPVT